MDIQSFILFSLMFHHRFANTTHIWNLKMINRRWRTIKTSETTPTYLSGQHKHAFSTKPMFVHGFTLSINFTLVLLFDCWWRAKWLGFMCQVELHRSRFKILALWYFNFSRAKRMDQHLTCPLHLKITSPGER